MNQYDFKLDLDSLNTMSVMDGWIRPDTAVLEIGPANGRLTRYLAEEKHCRMTIVELDETSGAEAARYAQKSYLGPVQGDAEALHWVQSGETYDYIIFADVLEHLRNPQRVLENCSKVLKEDGSILLSVPNLAHNSVMISLLKERFEYDETGLLDRTHVHFFTYSSLRRMIREAGWHLQELVPVYSRVGDNEVEAHYTEVPRSVEQYLRTRPTGSVYQFVCRIGRQTCGEEPEEFCQPFDQELHHNVEVQCYYRTADAEGFSDDRCVHRLIPGDGVQHQQFDLPADVQKVRLDPMGEPCVLLLEQAQLLLADGTAVDCTVESSTAKLHYGSFFLFTGEPEILFRQVQTDSPVRGFCAAYRVLSFGEPEAYYADLARILEDLAADARTPAEQQKEALQSRLEEALEFQTHLQQDLQDMTAARAEEQAAAQRWSDQLSESLEAAKTWNAQLEENLAAAKAWNAQLEEGLAAAKDWNVHLEQDLQALIAARQQDSENHDAAMAEARAWIAHLEKDIEQLKQQLA